MTWSTCATPFTTTGPAIPTLYFRILLTDRFHGKKILGDPALTRDLTALTNGIKGDHTRRNQRTRLVGVFLFLDRV